MAINVYWASSDINWLAQKTPDLVISKFYNNNVKTNDENVIRSNRCPAIFDELQNTFNIYSIYDYEVTLANNSVYSNQYDQEFLKHYVEIRSFWHKLISYRQQLVFFTDEDSLEATVSLFPYMEDNNITKRCKIIPGKLDVGKWFRLIDFAFFLKEGHDTFKVDKDEVMYYIKFHTKEKINFKQFAFSDKLVNYSFACSNMVRYNVNSPLLKLENYYKMFKHKKLILREIKDNLL